MPVIIGTFESETEMDRAVSELASAGIPLDALAPAQRQDSGKDEIGLKITVDVDHADKVVRIFNAHGHASKRTEAELSYPDDRVTEHRRFVTENRDTSREPDLARDDVQIIENAPEIRHRPPGTRKPK